jgi:hypothetical protein
MAGGVLVDPVCFFFKKAMIIAIAIGCSPQEAL